MSALMAEPKLKSDETAELVRLYDLYRSALMNEKYFGCRLDYYRRLNRAGEILLALTASGTVGGWAIWTSGWGAVMWKLLGCISTVLAILKPILQLSKQIELHSKVYIGYCSLYYDLKSLVSDIQFSHAITAETRKSLRLAQDRYKSLALQVDFPANSKLLGRCMDQVNTQVPASGLWVPISNNDRRESDEHIPK
jgi:hypothetical protein